MRALLVVFSVLTCQTYAYIAPCEYEVYAPQNDCVVIRGNGIDGSRARENDEWPVGRKPTRGAFCTKYFPRKSDPLKMNLVPGSRDFFVVECPGFDRSIGLLDIPKCGEKLHLPYVHPLADRSASVPQADAKKGHLEDSERK